MYDILNASDITINEHGAVAAYANNYRLYEATGLGTCLVTDWKETLMPKPSILDVPISAFRKTRIDSTISRVERTLRLSVTAGAFSARAIRYSGVGGFSVN